MDFNWSKYNVNVNWLFILKDALILAHQILNPSQVSEKPCFEEGSQTNQKLCL